MFNLRVTEEQIDYADRQTRRYNFGHRGIGDGTRNMQRTGIIGQTAVCDLFGCIRPDGCLGSDGGVDIDLLGKRIDVKTMGRTTYPKPEFVNNFVGLQKDLPTDAFIFCSYHHDDKVLTVCGMITKRRFLSIAKFYPEGSIRYRTDGTSFVTRTDLYELENRYLTDVDNPEDILRFVIWKMRQESSN